jgi:hypothetical protein
MEWIDEEGRYDARWMWQNALLNHHRHLPVSPPIHSQFDLPEFYLSTVASTTLSSTSNLTSRSSVSVPIILDSSTYLLLSIIA